MMADGVYKVGRTQQDYGNHLKRLKAYPGDSIISMVLKVHDDVVVEREVLRRCRLAFGVHPRGLEYFKGPEDEFMKIIYECKNFTPKVPVPKVPVPKVPVPPKVPEPYRRLNDVEKYLRSRNPKHGRDLFVPLAIIERAYEEFCEGRRRVPINFREHCPLPIVRMEGSVTWKAVNHSPLMTFENPELVQGVNLRGFSTAPKNHLSHY